MRYISLVICLVVIVGITGCSWKDVKKEASYPTRPDNAPSDKIIYSNEKRQTIWGEGESITSRFFGNNDTQSGGGGIGVNSFLWRASLDTISFLPLQNADPFGGVILTDWYEDPKTQGERFKMNVYIMDRQLRSDGIKVAVFKQKIDNRGNWRDAEVNADTNLKIENTILTRARELRVAQQSAN